MRDGKIVSNNDLSQVDIDFIVSQMVGGKIKANSDEKKSTQVMDGQPILMVSGLNKKGVLKDISLSLREGEVLGLTGLVGAGKTELVRALFGADRIDSGDIYIKGKKVAIRTPQDAVEQGMGLVPENRNTEGLVVTSPINENITLATPEAIQTKFPGIISATLEKKSISGNRWIQRLAIKMPSLKTLVSSLSGGNRQKVVLAKWLFKNSTIILFDEPTRGIDVQAKSEIRGLIRQLATEGKAIIVSSCEFDEIIKVSDRIIVMHEGRIGAELPSTDATEEVLLKLSSGTKSSL
jgi:ribose transport system ATP-binding protein